MMLPHKILCIFSLLIFCGCGFNHELGTESSLFIGQDQFLGFGLDNIEVNADETINNYGFNKNNLFIKTELTLSKHSNSITVLISGGYLEPLSSLDISNLRSIGLEVGNNNKKGQLSSIAKNLSADESLAYNIKINATLYYDEKLTSEALKLQEGIIWVGGDNHYDGEFLTPVPGENYFLFHEWEDTKLGAIQILPEGNYRKIFLINTPSLRWDTLEFIDSIPQVNGFPVAYAMAKDVRDVYKITNDGSGLFGWTISTLGTTPTNLTNRFEDLPLVNNGEAVLLTAHRVGGSTNQLISILEWDGANWVETSLGTAIKAQAGGTWDDTRNYISNPFNAPDGSYWFVIIEYQNVLLGDPAIGDGLNVPTDLRLLRMEYLGGAVNVVGNWSTELFDVESSQIGNHDSRIYKPYFLEYIDKNNFNAYISGSGLGKIVASNGSINYSAIASHPPPYNFGSTSWDYPFPIGLDDQGLQQVKNCNYIRADIINPSKLICQGFDSMFSIDTNNNDKIEQILGRGLGNVVKYTR